MSGKAPKPVYILHGKDDYLRRLHRREIVRALTGSAEAELAVTHFDASAELSDVLDELRTAPFLSARRVIIVHNADPFVTRHRRRLEEYIRNPSATGSLIVEVSSEKPNTKLVKLSREVGQVIDCSSPSEASLPGWISRAVRDRGKTISSDAAGMLAEWVGADLARLDSEIEKLVLYVGKREEISAEDVATAVVATAGPNPFALTNAIAAGDAKRALEVLGALLTRRGEEFRVLGMIGWYLRSCLEGRRPSYGGRGRPRPPSKILHDFRLVLQADLAMKTGAEPLTTMQMLLIGLCR